jgi:hypothetical protein
MVNMPDEEWEPSKRPLSILFTPFLSPLQRRLEAFSTTTDLASGTLSIKESISVHNRSNRSNVMTIARIWKN